jgi:hypothetical protein
MSRSAGMNGFVEALRRRRNGAPRGSLLGDRCYQPSGSLRFEEVGG